MNEAGLKKAKMKSLAFPLLAFMLRVLLTLHALGLPCNFCSKSSFEVATRLPFYLHFQPLFDATINIMVVLSYHDCYSHLHEDDDHDDDDLYDDDNDDDNLYDDDDDDDGLTRPRHL